MSNAKKYVIPFLAIVCILMAGCEKRYWYRQKVRVFTFNRKVKTMRYTVNNFSPQFLSNKYEKEMEDYGFKKLYKKGFEESKRDTPQYIVTISFRVDSFKTEYSRHFMVGRTYRVRKSDDSNPIYEYYAGSDMVKQITIEYSLYHVKTQFKLWETKSELYFLDNEWRDISRSKSMMGDALRKMPID